MEEFEIYKVLQESANYYRLAKTELYFNIFADILITVFIIVFIVKFWCMANDMEEIREHLGFHNLAQFKYKSKMVPDMLRKGRQYNLGKLGLCTFDGVLGDKYQFHPLEDDKIDKSSPYYIDLGGSYYWVPEDKLKEVWDS